ncbi:MAG TPA: hypothetical protein VF240_21230 [Pyrinomonadaceae bacterium]
MFCQSCGTALTKGLTYCNRCGARAAPSALTAVQKNDKLAEVVYVLATFSAGVSLGGLAAVYFLIRELLRAGFEQSRIVVVTFFCLLAVVGLAFLLINQMSRALNVFLHSGAGADEGQATAANAPKLADVQTAQIEAPREPVASVTDHTTRTFDPVYEERRS